MTWQYSSSSGRKSHFRGALEVVLQEAIRVAGFLVECDTDKRDSARPAETPVARAATRSARL